VSSPVKMAREIIDTMGGKENINNLQYCMTRMRVTPKDAGKVDVESLKKVEGVMGVVESSGQYQIIVGPGIVNKLAAQMEELTGVKVGETRDLRSEIKDKNRTPFKMMLRRIAGIFIPLIPALIGCGLIMGINNILLKFGAMPENLGNILGVLGNAVFMYLSIMVGINTAREFGGSPALGGVMAGILSHPNLTKITIAGKNLIPGRGGIIAVLLAVVFTVWLEKRIRKMIPEILDIILTPTLTVLIAGIATLFVIQPIGGIISEAIGMGVKGIIEGGGFIVGAILAGTFLPLVMTGLHHGLTPIHAELLQSTGVNTLLPILAMAGAGQVGAAIAVYVKTKNNRLKKTVLSGLPVGIMGIGEPLIFGVTLPLGKPFLSACIGAAFGGAVQAVLKVGSTSMGLSGLPLAAIIVPEKIPFYLLGVVVSYIAGFIATMIIGFDDPVDEDVDGAKTTSTGFTFGS